MFFFFFFSPLCPLNSAFILKCNCIWCFCVGFETSYVMQIETLTSSPCQPFIFVTSKCMQSSVKWMDYIRVFDTHLHCLTWTGLHLKLQYVLQDIFLGTSKSVFEDECCLINCVCNFLNGKSSLNNRLYWVLFILVKVWHIKSPVTEDECCHSIVSSKWWQLWNQSLCTVLRTQCSQHTGPVRSDQ